MDRDGWPLWAVDLLIISVVVVVMLLAIAAGAP